MREAKNNLWVLVFLITTIVTNAQNDESEEKRIEKNWFENFKIGGYMQARYNDLYKTNPDLISPQGDRTYGGYHGFSLRRMRMKISGQIHPRVYFYFQADFASDGKNLGQLRDAYFDYFIDEEGTFKIRGGQSKIPFGFENLQSSQNRIGLDRNEPLNSAVKDERDLSVGLHWAPVEKREMLRDLVSKGLKGAGNYGMAYIMFYNGQRANTLVPNVNKQVHIAMRFTYPFQLKSGQYIEAGIQAYTGNCITTEVSEGVTYRDENGNVTNIDALGHQFLDQRMAFSFMYYPQPFGVQIEYNFGKGPQYKYAPETDGHSIGIENLSGGYAQLMYMIRKEEQIITPFTRYMYYNGGKKFELDSRSYGMSEFEAGVEWQINKAIELTTNYTYADRRQEDSLAPINRENGHLIRIQLQINY